VTPTLPAGVIFAATSILDVSWSPDGRQIAVISGGKGAPTVAQILDRAGHVERSFSAYDFAWLSDDTFVATGDPDLLNSPSPGSTAWMGITEGSTTAAIPGSYSQLVAGPAGSAALTLNEIGSDHYVVVGHSGLSAPRDGVPVAFSPDGTMIAVVHYPVACCAGAPSPGPTAPPGPPTLDVVRTDTGKSLATDADVEWAYGAYLAFSPDSRRIAFVMYPEDNATTEQIGLLDIGSRRLWVIGPTAADASDPRPPVWADSNHLIIQGWSSGSATAGLPATVSYESSNAGEVEVSLTGVIARLAPDSATVSVRGSEQTTFNLPFGGTRLLWSPDGTDLLAVVSWGDGRGEATYGLVIRHP